MDPSEIVRLVQRDPWRAAVLDEVGSHHLKDCWVAAGFVRNVVWDHLHDHSEATPLNDIDVIYFDGELLSPDHDRQIEGELNSAFPGETFSVKNQARMHVRNGDSPYSSATDAMRRWPEKCTAIGISCSSRGVLSAPYGLHDLVGLVVRPTALDMQELVQRRMAAKNWRQRWPRLRLEPVT
jgi:hypothetical protein